MENIIISQNICNIIQQFFEIIHLKVFENLFPKTCLNVHR